MSISHHFFVEKTFFKGSGISNSDNRWLKPIVMLLAAGILLLSTAVNAEVPGVTAPQGTHSGEDVPQPIKFPHNTHADVNKINCM